jgi:LysM repeat protein
MQMASHENKFPKTRRLVKNTSTLLVALAFLLISCALAVFLATQPHAAITTAVATQSSPATGTQPTNAAAAPSPAAPAATAADSLPATAQAIPKAIQPPVADGPTAAPPVAEAAPPAPQPTAPPGAPADTAINANQYTVVAGDTVGAIASRFGVDVNGMLAANGLGAFTIIRPGQTLKLSGPPVEVPKSTASAPVAPRVPPAVRTVFVAGSGGQAMVDRCIGPIHFTPTDAYTLFIVEHEFCGGWERFSGIRAGETVVLAGYGTYTAAGRGQVPRGGTTNDVAAVFGGFPRAILQTCIPGTNTMLLIALN